MVATGAFAVGAQAVGNAAVKRTSRDVFMAQILLNLAIVQFWQFAVLSSAKDPPPGYVFARAPIGAGVPRSCAGADGAGAAPRFGSYAASTWAK